jgi:hypothetical protein
MGFLHPFHKVCARPDAAPSGFQIVSSRSSSANYRFERFEARVRFDLFDV